jgi:hypothetical protein
VIIAAGCCGICAWDELDHADVLSDAFVGGVGVLLVGGVALDSSMRRALLI